MLLETNGSGHDKTPKASFSRTRFRAVLRIALIFVVYLLAFAILDSRSHALQVFPGIVAWYPPDGLSFALLLTFGARFLPALAIASLISNYFIFRLPLSFSELFLWAIIISLAYGFATWFLRRRIRLDTQLRNTRDLFWMIASAAAVSTVLAVISVSSSTATGVVPQAERLWAMFQWWIGEMIGILVVTPALLVHVMPHVKRFAEGEALLLKTPISFTRPSPWVILQALSIIMAIYLAVDVSWPNNFHPFFLIAIPLIWIAIHRGLSGASVGNVLVNFGITWRVRAQDHFNLAELGQLQLMMLVISMASLLIGIIVSEDRRSVHSPITEMERRRKKVVYELIIIFISAMAAWILEYTFEFYQAIVEWETRNHIRGVDETLMTILVLGGASAVFSYRRWKEVQVEVREREKTQAELQTLYRELEARVQERTADLSKANELLVREIAERKEAEKALHQSETRFRALIEHSTDAVTLLDSNGVVVYDSPAAPGMLGYNSDELIGQNIFKLLHPEDLAHIQPLFERLIDTPGARANSIFRILHRNGSWRWIESVVTNLLAEPSVKAVVANYRDITERKQAEEEIRMGADELLALYALSRALAEADDLDEVLELVNRHAVESVHTTFARIALLEGDKLVMRAAYPIRVPGQDLLVGDHIPVTALPYCQRAMEQNEPVILRASDPELSSDERAALLLDSVQSICLIPLRSSGHEAKSKQALGLLMLGESRSEGREPFSPAKIRMAQSIGDQTAITIRRTLLQRQTERRLQNLTALREIDQAITSSFGLRVSMSTLITQVIDQLHVDATCVWLFDPNSQMLNYSVGRGFRATAFEQAKPLQLGEGYAGRAVAERQTIHIANVMTEQDNPRLMRALELEAFVGYYAVPLIARGDVKGVLEVFHRALLEPDEEWLNFLASLAGQAAIAIDNATLFDNLLRSNYQLTQAYDATIEGWSAALDLRDKETEGHTQRVAEMTLRLAKRMGVSEQELIQMRRGALLHDIGKMGVPDSILLKPDKLTDEEWKVMRMHPTYAYQLLKQVAYLGPALDIPYSHHEKWDGTGYPRGLKGEQIPLAARIFAIVDVYDALTSDRPYRKGWLREKTLDHIRELSGSHFDSQVVNAFLKMMDEDS